MGMRSILRSVFVLILLLSAACSNVDDGAPASTEQTLPTSNAEAEVPPVPTVEAVDDSTEEAVPVVTPTAEPIDVAAMLANDDLVIFSAFPPKPDDITYEIPLGQSDFDALWLPDAAWQEALATVDIYRIHAFQVRHSYSDEQLTTLFAFLKEHDIPMMLETEPLLPPDPDRCEHTESYEGPFDFEMVERIHSLGGVIDAIAIEEPFHYAYLLQSEGACKYTVERVVEEVMVHVNNIRGIYGDIPVGTIEPIWKDPWTQPEDLALWLDTFKEMTGESFAFLHIDPDYTREDWAEIGLGIEAVADERNVPFGILYTGGSETSSESWMQFMMEQAAVLEMEYGATPQHVSFQQFAFGPETALPETDLAALTSSLLRYTGDRIHIELETTDEGIVAVVLDEGGNGVEGVPLTITSTSLDVAESTQIITGIVPENATTGLVLMRGNAENAGVGIVDTGIYEIIYRDGGSDENQILNPTFRAGLNGWGAYGNNQGIITTSNSGGSHLVLQANPDQDVFVDGELFAVTPGSAFEYTVRYTVGAEGNDNTVVSLVFPDTSAGRFNIFSHTNPVEQGVLMTDASGQVLLTPELLGTNQAQIEVSFAGDFDLWPTSARVSWMAGG